MEQQEQQDWEQQEQQDCHFTKAFDFWSTLTTRLVEQTSSILFDVLKAPQHETLSPLNPLVMGKAFSEAVSNLAQNPAHLLESHEKLSSDLFKLWMATLDQMNTGTPPPPIIEPEKNDRRFQHHQWEEHPYFNLLKQSYLLSSKSLYALMNNVPGLDRKTARKVSFYTRQLIDALSPSNFPLTNPKIVEKTLTTGGENLLKGFKNFLLDLEKGKGRLAISMTPPNAFELGVTLATTPGKIVFQNELLQLIQYAPTTKTVARVPLLIAPPWINKYYIFDLRPSNSFVRFALEQGHSVFMISWVNPESQLAHKTFENYMLDGLLEALLTVEKITSEPQVNLIGYCLGGNLAACLLAYLSAKKRKDVASVTYLATLIDFDQAGDLTVFIDEEQLRATEAHMAEKGYLDGHLMAATFSLLRANDLVWSFVINNYLLGEEPLPLDFLYWNGDSTRMPAAMHSYYLRNMFQQNLLRQPGGLTLGGVPIDLRTITVPTFILAARDDHIAPWQNCYEGVHLYKGPVEFILALSGHVAGIINPPTVEKYAYLTGPSHKKKDALKWLKDAKETKGSWWPYWQKWVSKHQKNQVPARLLDEDRISPLEDAPGSYVKVKN